MTLQRTTPKRDAKEPIAMSSDGIISVIRVFITEERKRNFSFLGRYSHCYKDPARLLVVEPASSDNVASLKQETVNVTGAQWFTFTEPIDPSHRTVAIKALDAENVKIESMVIGMDADSMCDAATWMRDTYCSTQITPAKFSAMLYEEQGWWWHTTGKSFQFLQLPLELREMIYIYAIGLVCVPEIVTVGGQMKFIFGVGQTIPRRSRAEYNRDPDVPRPDLSILRINKQVHKEAMVVASRDIVKRFTAWRRDLHSDSRSSPSTIWRSAPTAAPNSVHGISFLRRIQLEMSAADYFASIGIHPRKDQPLATGESGPLDLNHLLRFDSLKELDLRFISPKHRLARCPWTDLPGVQQEHVCQLKWIDFFLILAWDILRNLHVQKHVRISMSGCIKTQTRVYWSGKLNSTTADYTAHIKTMDKVFRAVMQKHGSDVALHCGCTNPCSVYTSPRRRKDFEDHRDERLNAIEGWQEILNTAYWDFEC